jgi:hypothetical protein
MDVPPMSIKIVSVNKMDDGVLVTFEDGVEALFDATFLYHQVDKRVNADSDESGTVG